MKESLNSKSNKRRMKSLLSSKKRNIYIAVSLNNGSTMEQLKIDLGKGVVVTAPVKQRMTAEEWLRMTKYINSVIHLERAQLLRK